MNRSENVDATNWPVARHLNRMAEAVRALLKKDEFHFWIADALLSVPATLAPIIVERGETLEGNLRQIFLTLSERERAEFRAAVTRASIEHWPPQSASPSLAILDMLRLARLSEHYGLVRWVGEEIIRLMSAPKTPNELKALADAIAILGDVESWMPQASEEGPDQRFILGKLHNIFTRLGSRNSLSFLDAALLIPAVRYDGERWSELISAAIQRYDIRKTPVFPGDWRTFGGDRLPEGIGLYDLRSYIVRALKNLTFAEIEIGMTALISNARTIHNNEGAGMILLQILRDLGYLSEKDEILQRFPQAPSPRIHVTQPARVFYFGPALVFDMHQGLFRFATADDMQQWMETHWSLGAAFWDQAYENILRWPPIAFWPGTTRAVHKDELPAYPTHSRTERATVRNLSAFRGTLSAKILSYAAEK